ncbi:MAG: 16S rRNA (guanine(527)-N(7))-methyltransferase RsmG [Bacteroidia bacterium]
MDVSLLSKYFELSKEQISLFSQFAELFIEKNKHINLVSRKDADNLVERHLLHSLTIGNYYNLSNAKVLDVGTGGGFPGLPLAILFNDAHFTLIDSKRKKIDAVNEFANQLGLKNVVATHVRAEELKGNFDFVVSRAVTSLDKFSNWVFRLIKQGFHNQQAKGIIYLRGVDFDFNSINDEINQEFDCNRIISLDEHFKLDFFSSKKIVFLQKL